jgi:hypothetical protein
MADKVGFDVISEKIIGQVIRSRRQRSIFSFILSSVAVIITGSLTYITIFHPEAQWLSHTLSPALGAILGYYFGSSSRSFKDSHDDEDNSALLRENLLQTHTHLLELQKELLDIERKKGPQFNDQLG